MVNDVYHLSAGDSDFSTIHRIMVPEPSVPQFLPGHVVEQPQTPSPVQGAQSTVEGQVVGKNLVVSGG